MGILPGSLIFPTVGYWEITGHTNDQRGFIVAMAGGFIVTTILGTVMAVTQGGNRRTAFHCLAFGVLFPLFVSLITAIIGRYWRRSRMKPSNKINLLIRTGSALTRAGVFAKPLGIPFEFESVPTLAGLIFFNLEPKELQQIAAPACGSGRKTRA